MAKRLLVLCIMVGVLVGTSGVAAAWRHDFENRGARDNPARIIVFPFFVAGVLLDSFVIRPINVIACFMPDLTGCSPDERRALGLEEERAPELPREWTD